MVTTRILTAAQEIGFYTYALLYGDETAALGDAGYQKSGLKTLVTQSRAELVQCGLHVACIPQEDLRTSFRMDS